MKDYDADNDCWVWVDEYEEDGRLDSLSNHDSMVNACESDY